MRFKIGLFVILMGCGVICSAQDSKTLDLIWRMDLGADYLYRFDFSSGEYSGYAPMDIRTGIEVQNLLVEDLILGIRTISAVYYVVDAMIGYRFPLNDFLSWQNSGSLGVCFYDVFSQYSPHFAVESKLAFEIPFGISIDPSVHYSGTFLDGVFVQTLGAGLGFSIVAFPRESGTASTSMPILNVGKPGISISSEWVSPNNDGNLDLIRLIPTARGAYKAFEIHILDSKGKSIKTYSGSNPISQFIDWDAKGVTDGEYCAQLKLTFDDEVVTVKSNSFWVDTKPPVATLELSGKIISPDGDGSNEVVTFTVTSQDASGVENWRLRIYDRIHNVFWERTGTEAKAIISWQGLSLKGEPVQSGDIYTIEFQVQDRAGNISSVTDAVKADILVKKSGENLKIVLSSIVFSGDSADFLVGDPSQVKRNLEILEELVVTLKKYQDYNLILNGYASNTKLGSQNEIDKENLNELIPLSLRRAENIRNALVDRGIPSSSIVISGKGNANPIVPLSDKTNQWKNRRVEFVLIRKEN